MNDAQDHAVLTLDFRRVEEPEAQQCAEMMARSEPWITLGRGFSQCLERVRDPSREVYGAHTGGDLVGFVILCMIGALVGYVQTICVHPDWRRRGIGTRMLRFAEGRILAEGPNVFLCVSSFNPDARRLYQRLGYEVIGELKDYVVAGHSEILLRKSIGPLCALVPPSGARANEARD